MAMEYGFSFEAAALLCAKVSKRLRNAEFCNPEPRNARGEKFGVMGHTYVAAIRGREHSE